MRFIYTNAYILINNTNQISKMHIYPEGGGYPYRSTSEPASKPKNFLADNIFSGVLSLHTRLARFIVFPPRRLPCPDARYVASSPSCSPPESRSFSFRTSPVT